MERRANYGTVGAFVLLITAGMVVALLWAARAQLHQTVMTYRTHLQGPVTGLAKGAPVRLNGIDIGHVADLTLDADRPTEVVLTLEIQSQIHLHQDAEASQETQGLTGISYVEISGGSKDAPSLSPTDEAPIPEIRSRASALQAVTASAPEILGKALQISERLAKLLDEQNRIAISQTLGNVRDVSATVARHDPDLDRMLADSARITRSLAETSEGVAQAVGQVNQILARLEATAGRADQLVASAGEASRKVGQLVGNVDGILIDSRPQIREFTSVGLSQLTQLTSETRTLVANLTRISAELERDPTRFLFGDRRKGFNPE